MQYATSLLFLIHPKEPTIRLIFTGAQLPINGDCVFHLAYRVYLKVVYK